MNYIVSQRVLDQIELECRRNPDTETGGILVGSRDADQLSITHSTGPGLQWEGSSYHFVKDTEYLQSVLNILFEYFGVNYLGVWHKHPRSTPHPSTGDIASAMEEVDDPELGLGELITPICVMESGHVQVLPFAIKERSYRVIEWTPRNHDEIQANGSLRGQWYNTEVGRKRLIEELDCFDDAGVDVELRKGNDETYRINVKLTRESNCRLVILCPAEYPVIAPEVAIYYEDTNEYQPLRSKLLDNWNIYVYLAEVIQEYQNIKSDSGVLVEQNIIRSLPPQNWVRDGHQAAKVLCYLAWTAVTVATWPSDLALKVAKYADRLEKWCDDRDQ